MKKFWVGYFTGIIISAICIGIDGFWLSMLVGVPVLLAAVALADGWVVED